MSENPEYRATAQRVLQQLKVDGALQGKDGEELTIDGKTGRYAIAHGANSRTALGDALLRDADARKRPYLDYYFGHIENGDVEVLESVLLTRARLGQCVDRG